jgi:transcriptional regulator with XRE-family HTH domain
MPKEPTGVEVAGTLLRQLRKIKGLEMSDFAAAVGISHGYLSQIERGHAQTVSPTVFGRICEVLELTDRRDLLAKAAA